jgi:tRNA dimethylallyltransferase
VLPALAVVGCTASGKSAFALAVARATGAELIAVDAMTVYRGMDIGTAKATLDERAEVPHHCLDLADPADEVTLVAYRDTARAALADASSRGVRTILVGGTGLYVRAVLDGLDPPGRWPDIRAGLEALAVTPEAIVALHRELTERDPEAAARIEPGNARRIVRALEVCRGSGQPFSSFGPGLEAYPTVPTRQVGLQWDRGELERRIARRVDAQLSAGWLAEVAALWPVMGRTARQVIGYGELAEHLDGAISLEEARARIVARTRKFAVRQERWFRRDPRIEWISGDRADDLVASVVSEWT